MSFYRKIDKRIWGDEKFSSLSKPQPNAQSLFIYLISSRQNSSLPSVFYGGVGSVSEALAWNYDETKKCFEELCINELIKFDSRCQIVWIKNALKYNFPGSINSIKGLRNVINEIPECELKSEIIQSLLGEALGKSLDVQDAVRFAIQDAEALAFYINKNTNINTNTNKKKTSKKFLPPRRSAARCDSSEKQKIQEVFLCWQQTMGHNGSKLDDKRRSAIKKGLGSGYDVAQLCEAIRGCSLTPFNMGQNDRGQRYDGLNIIMRDSDQIDRFIHNAKCPPRAKSGATLRMENSIAEAQRFLNSSHEEEGDL